MRRYLNYIKYILVHKYWVFVAGRILNVPVKQLLLHDMSKFTAYEFPQYAKTFYDSDGNSTFDPHPDFDKAWMHHIKHNPHHWEYWVAHNTASEMRPEYVRELVADLAGTGKVKQGVWEFHEWFEANAKNMDIHPRSLKLIQTVMEELQNKLIEKGMYYVENR